MVNLKILSAVKKDYPGINRSKRFVTDTRQLQEIATVRFACVNVRSRFVMDETRRERIRISGITGYTFSAAQQKAAALSAKANKSLFGVSKCKPTPW